MTEKEAGKILDVLVFPDGAKTSRADFDAVIESLLHDGADAAP